MFRNKPFGAKTTVNLLLSNGGVGDMVASLVSVDYILKNYIWLNPLIWVPDYLLDFAKHVLPKGALVRNYTTAKKKYNEKLPGITTGWVTNHTPMRTHPVDYAFHMLADKHEYDISKKNYLQIRPNEIDLSKFNLPEKYIVIAPVSVEQVKRFHPVVVNQISDYVKSLGYTPVYLGKEETSAGLGPQGGKIKASVTPANYEKGLNLINQTTLLESTAIIAGAKLFVGMDGGLVHLAGSTQTKIIVGYTFISPEHNVPIRNNQLGYEVYPVVPDVSLGCRFCQTNWGMMYDVDFRTCKYGDYECVKQITFDKIKVEMDKIL